MLKAIGLNDEVQKLVNIRGWDCLLSIHEHTYHDLTLEFLASFEFDRATTDFGKDKLIRFRCLGQYYGMSLTQFSILMELCSRDFIHTREYEPLLAGYP